MNDHPIRIDVPGEPASKARARFAVRGGSVRTYTPKKTVESEALIAWHVRAARQPWMKKRSAYRVYAEFHCATWQRRDVDNMMKLILDACNEIVWTDDVQVCEIHGRVFRGVDEARTIVEISPVEGVNVPPTTPCAACGTDVRVYKSQSKAAKRYCSRECQHAAQSMKVDVPCAGCGDTLRRTPRSLEMVAEPYCSIACKSAHLSVDVTCAECGKQERRPKSLVRTGMRTYCTKECAKVFQRKRRAQGATGECLVCGTTTSKKSYRRCRACFEAGRDVAA